MKHKPSTKQMIVKTNKYN